MKRQRLSRKGSRKRENRMMLLSGKHEELGLKDLGKYDVPSDKIHVGDEPYESFYTVFNREDAVIFKREFNNIAKRILGIEIPLVVRRHVQGKTVFYDIYEHRWAVRKDGKLLEVDVDWKFDPVKLNMFHKEVNKKLGKVYAI